MEWTKYTIHTLEGAEDLIGSMLNDIGIIGVEIDDLRPVGAEENGGYFGEVVPELPEDDFKARISFYLKKGRGDGSFSEKYDPGTGPLYQGELSERDRKELALMEADPAEVLEKVRAGLAEIASYCDIGEGTITEEEVREEDWANSWKQYFHAFTVSGVRIVPSFEEDSENDKGEADLVLYMDPGTAFGTGQHESTQLAIEALRKNIREGDAVLDIGTGSGILGMIAMKDGASRVFATDLDPNVPAALAENLAKNGISAEDFVFCAGDIAKDESVAEKAGGGYRIVTANIIAEILAGIIPAVRPLMAEDGALILSGILASKMDIIEAALAAAGMKAAEVGEMGEWRSVTAVPA